MIHAPLEFALRTEDDSNLTPDLSAVENGLSATDLPQGQKVSGPIAVDVPPGKVITQIVLTNGLGGTQLGLWFSRGQLKDQLVDDDADTRSLAARAIPAVEQCAIAQRVAASSTGVAAWHGHCISGHCTSWGSHGCGVM
jgi:hypothetical protein